MVAVQVRTRNPSATSYNSNPNVKLDLREFTRIAEVMKTDAGIHMTESKINLVHARLQKRLRALSMTSFKNYCDLVESREGTAERKIMMNALTTNLTRFFRETHHFKHLLKTSLPPLVQRAKDGGRVRIWSAGCSTGEEPYSIASVLLTLCPDAARYDIKILASDIDSNVIETGRAGIYDANGFDGVPEKIKKRFFSKSEDAKQKYVANEDLKNLISFRHLNLNNPNWPMSGLFDIIFCRNTVIYFDTDTQEKVWSNLIRKLAPEGHLYAGHSEKVKGPKADLVSRVGTTIYKIVETET